MEKKSSRRYCFRSMIIRRMIIALLLMIQLTFIVASILYYSKLLWLSFALRLLGFLTAFHLLTHPYPSAMKISLVFTILLFPLFGGALYWFFHFQTPTRGYKRALRRIRSATDSAYRATQTDTQAAMSELPEAALLIRYLDQIPKFPVYGHTDVAYYPDGAAFRDALLEALHNAERYIFLEYFIIGEGVFWDAVLSVLQEKAAQGLDVRVIYDDLGSYVTLPHRYADRLRGLGIQCRPFNPFVPFLKTVQNNRDHRKIAVIDGRIAFTGGINLADEYTNDRERFGHWKDSAVRLSGNGAWSLAVTFLQTWSFLVNRQENWEVFHPLQGTLPPTVGRVQPYADSPIDGEHVGEQVYLRIIQAAEESLYLTTPYLAPDDSLLTALKSAAKCGVDVRILLPGIPDKPLVQFTSRSYYRELIEAGVRIFEYTEGFVHSKCMLADCTVASIGTVNLDFRSLYHHFECGVCLYRTPALEQIRTDFLTTLERSREIVLSDCRAGLWKRFWQDVCRLIAPII